MATQRSCESRTTVTGERSCDWRGREGDQYVSLIVVPNRDVLVDTYRIRQYSVFQPTVIAGLPATREQSSLEAVSCLVTVGTADGQGFITDYTVGACPGCTNLGDGLEGSLIHVNHRDVTLICFSRAPIERLTAYKERMGWQFPYVSTYNTDFAFDFGLALTEEQAEQIPEVKEMIANPPDWLQDWSEQVGADLKDGLREAPSWIAFARDGDTVYHTYTVMAPDPFVAPYYSSLLERTPIKPAAEPRAWRKDEYPD